jgi:hypothetical protein
MRSDIRTREGQGKGRVLEILKGDSDRLLEFVKRSFLKPRFSISYRSPVNPRHTCLSPPLRSPLRVPRAGRVLEILKGDFDRVREFLKRRL